ncbi:MAG: KTSC domain-containing protein [Rickettsiales bacterium]|nr:KTSC domain-containing protein [Rickettsiales bacterium]
MYRLPVQSSNIKSVGFDSNILEIEFHSGGIYQYFDVPTDVYHLFMNTPSKGKFFDQFIKKIYRYQKVG